MPDCPSCLSSSTRRSRRQRSSRLPRAWYQVVYRCDDCGKRFVVTNPVFTANWARASALFLLVAFVSLWIGLDDPNPEHSQLARQSQPLSSAPAARAATGYTGYLDLDPLRAEAQDGDRNAQYRLAVALTQEYKASGDQAAQGDSLRWLREAAANGHPQAQAEMGDLYLAGRGVVQDFIQAADWYRKAADQGDAEAMYSLGKMAQAGWGMDENLVEAYIWLNLASARGEARADGARGQVMALLSAEELKNAQKRSRDLDEAISGSSENAPEEVAPSPP